VAIFYHKFPTGPAPFLKKTAKLSDKFNRVYFREPKPAGRWQGEIMKFGIWAMIFTMAAWPVLHSIHPSMALANNSSSGTTSTETNSCSDNRPEMKGWKDKNCYNYDSQTANNDQQNTQTDTEDMNQGAGQQAAMMGMMAMAAGSGMIAAGMAMKPPNGGLIAAGAALLAAGMMGMSAAGKMANNAGYAGYNAGKMGDISGVPINRETSGTSIDSSKQGNSSGIKIDPSLTREGKVAAIFDDFEQKTGMSRDDFLDGLNSGRSAADILADASKMGMTADQLQNLADNAASTNPLSADEAMSQLGLTPEELAALAAKNAGMSATGENGSYAAGGSGSAGNRAPASAGGLDGLFAAKTDTGPSALGVGPDGLALSDNVQAALDRNGITGLSLFQMVHGQYKKKTPMMFGVPTKSPANHKDNPFGDLGSGDKISF